MYEALSEALSYRSDYSTEFVTGFGALEPNASTPKMHWPRVELCLEPPTYADVC